MRPTWREAFRPLPLSIAAMLLLAAVKLTGLLHWAGPSLALAGASAGRTVLPSATAAETKPPSAQPPRPDPKPEPVPQADAAAPSSGAPEPKTSDAERALLQDLRARREALDAREKAFAARETLLKATERGLTDRLDQLAALQARLEAMDKTRREHDEANWRGLVKTYESMRPRDAAVIFNELEQPVLLQVLDRMKEAKAAPILAAMSPDRARTATAQLVQWRTRARAGAVE